MNPVCLYFSIVGIIQGSGYVRTRGIYSLAEAVLSVALSLVFADKSGAGIVGSFVFSRLLTNGIYVPTAACKMVGLGWRTYVSKGVIRPIVWSLPGIAFTLVTAAELPISESWFVLMVVALVSGITNVAFFEGALFMKSEETNLMRRLGTAIAGAGSAP